MAFKDTMKSILKPNDEFGWIGNSDDTEKRSIIIEPEKDKGAIVDCILIGSLVAFAVGRVMRRSYLRGANAYMDAEYTALNDMGLLK